MLKNSVYKFKKTGKLCSIKNICQFERPRSFLALKFRGVISHFIKILVKSGVVDHELPFHNSCCGKTARMYFHGQAPVEEIKDL